MKTPRVAILADFAEEDWPSMDLVAEMAASRIPGATLIQPRLQRRFPPWAFSADRLINRMWDYPRFAARLRGFDLFHVMDHSYSQLIHSLPAGRTLVTCHDTDTFRCLFERQLEPRPFWFRTMAAHILRGMRKAALIICVSDATRQTLLRFGIAKPEKVVVVHNGIHPAFFEDAAPHQDGATELLHVGSTIPRKRIGDLLCVFAECHRAWPGLRLVHAGGPFTSSQTRLARELGVDGSITSLPFLSARALAAIYRRAALTLIPSEAEGFGLPLAESIACGTPVVASDLPALREIGGPAASYCPVGDVAAWSRRVRELLEERSVHPQSWASRTASCRHRATFFSWDRNAREIEAHYRTILFGANPGTWVGKLSLPAVLDSSAATPPAATSAREITLS
jgi:glycosyltransferase involved in cell wall biosynthesis